MNESEYLPEAAESPQMSPSDENASEAPAKTTRRGRPRKTATKKKTATRKKAASADEEATQTSGPEEIPETFSADPDDLDKDVEERQRAQEKQPPKKAEDADSSSQEWESSSRDDSTSNQRRDDDRNDDQRSPNNSQQQNRRDDRRDDNRQGHQGHRHHQGGGHHQRGQHQHQHQQKQNKKNKKRNKQQRQQGQRPPKSDWIAPGSFADYSDADTAGPAWGQLSEWEVLRNLTALEELAGSLVEESAEPCDFNALYNLGLPELENELDKAEISRGDYAPVKKVLIEKLIRKAHEDKRPIRASGTLEVMEDGFGFIVFEKDNYRPRELSVFVPAMLIRKYGLLRGHQVKALIHPPREGESCPFILRVESVMDMEPEKVAHLVPFTDLVPYYPTERALLETDPDVHWDNISMRVVDLLTPVGLGQRGLIVAPPRTGKTVLQQGIANALLRNKPNAHLIILLVDERPEEVTDFRRQVGDRAEVIASTFDESAESHVHAAEMVIEKARRMVEVGRDVIILLDSITRLARAYNTLMPSSGKILSGGVEATALQKPKRFFGSARNIEDGGSLTILGTALVETGSRMDEVIFEEFKGTGNMELHLDRSLVDKRIFPALSFEKSGTRKEEMLYHPAEMNKIYALRRAMKGVPSTEAMEMLIQRVKKTKTNAEFLMAMNR